MTRFWAIFYGIVETALMLAFAYSVTQLCRYEFQWRNLIGPAAAAIAFMALMRIETLHTRRSEETDGKQNVH